MKRSDFIKSMVGVFGLSFLPADSFKQYEKVYIKSNSGRDFIY